MSQPSSLLHTPLTPDELADLKRLSRRAFEGKYQTGYRTWKRLRRETANVSVLPTPQPEEELAARLNERRTSEQARLHRRAEITELRNLLTAERSRELYLETIREYAPRLSVPTVERTPGLVNPPHHTWVLILSDEHLSQTTTSEETGGLFTQTLDICKQQFADLWRRIELLHHIASQSVMVDELVILNLGDDHENSGMRPRQALEADGTVTQQCVDVVDMKAQLFQNALSLFPKVRVHVVGGNHDRISAKPGLAGLGELAYHDTYAWLGAEFLRRMFAPAIDQDRLALTNWPSFYGYDLIANQRFVFEHGASFRTSSGSYGGIGWYPIVNAAGRYQQMLDGADFVCMGHFHTAACLPLGRGWIVMNGAFPPSTAFVQSSFKRVSTPSQVLLDLHADVGLAGFRPLYLPHEGIAAPGAVWERLRAERAA